MARYRDLDRFDNYRTIQARFNSTGGCGHEIIQGQTIGYNGRLKRTMCPDCWAKWCTENAEAQAYEEQYSYCGGDW